jgi:hypothetical protein
VAEVTATLDIDRVENDVRIYLSDVSRDYVLGKGKELKAEVQRLIRERADVSTPGGLADSIVGDLFDEGGDAWGVHVSADAEHEDVALWFEEGTGLFGPRATYIVPRTHAFMWFRPRGAARNVRAIRVQGQEGKHPFRDGLQNVNL